MAEPTLQYVIYNLFPDQESRFIEAFEETSRRLPALGCRYELARAQGKAANYVLRIESDGHAAVPSLWLNEPLRWFLSSIISATTYERVERSPADPAVISH